MSLQLIVVRHGETDWTREGRYAGAHDVALNPLGLQQCEATARVLAGMAPNAVYASPLERARTSAEIIAKPHRLPVVIEPRFREMSFGDWEGCLRSDVASRFPDLYGTWWSTPQLACLPGAEPLEDVVRRVSEGLEGLRAQHEGERVVLVTHGVVIRLLVLGALGLGPDRLWSLEASPAGITELEFEADWATVHRMNTVVHLDGIDA
jgi:broad specificity phosphatase PhoE